MQKPFLVTFVLVVSATLSYQAVASVNGFTESRCDAPSGTDDDDFALLQSGAKVDLNSVDMRKKRSTSVGAGNYNRTGEASNKDVNSSVSETSETKLRQEVQKTIVDIRMKKSTSAGEGDYNITRGVSSKNINGSTAEGTSDKVLRQEEKQRVGENVSAMEVRENDTVVDNVSGSRGQSLYISRRRSYSYSSRRRYVTHVYSSRRRYYSHGGHVTHIYTSRRRYYYTHGHYHHGYYYSGGSSSFGLDGIIILLFLCCFCAIVFAFKSQGYGPMWDDGDTIIVHDRYDSRPDIIVHDYDSRPDFDIVREDSWRSR